MKNNIFELSWNDYEEYRPYLLSHEDKTEEQFKEDVIFILQKYGDEYLEQECSWAGADGWIDFVSDKLQELGYSPIKPTSFVSFFGSCIIEESDDDEEWREAVGERLYLKAIAHNRKIRDKIEREIKESFNQK